MVATLLADEIGMFSRGSWGFIAQVSPSPAVAAGQAFFAGFKGPIQNKMKGCPLFDLIAQSEAGDPDLLALNVEGRSPASWHSDRFLEAQRRTLPLPVFVRLYENRWAEGEDQFLTVAMVEGAIDAALNRGGVPATGEIVVLGLDVGLVCDRTILTAVALGPKAVRLIRARVWAGSHDGPVDLAEVQDAAAALYRELGAQLLVLDPWQAAQMNQAFIGFGLATSVHNFTGPSVERMAAGMYRLFANGGIKIPDDEDLRAELLGLTCKSTASGGYKWQHPSGGHDDRVVSLALRASPLFEAEMEPPADVERVVFLNPDPERELRDLLPLGPWM